jgi:alpha,alpha-trehalose phosphorylase
LRVGVSHKISAGSCSVSGPSEKTGTGEASLTWSASMKKGNQITLNKTAVFSDSRHHSDVRGTVQSVLNRISGMTFSDFSREQEEYLNDFWRDSGIEIDGDDHTLKGLRFNMYNLLQSAPDNPVSGIPAKGLSGEGYEGHYFWDTEIYMLPFFLYTRPELARNLLQFRHTTLPQAREHARILGHKRGAAYPWRTIAGRECSTYYPSGSAQYHINADIAYAVWRYWEATEDADFIGDYGAEILFETARIWLEIGNFYRNGFHIHTVTGPDEYTCLVDNNYYTNKMARKNLETAADIHEWMKQFRPEQLSSLSGCIELKEAEVESWRKAAAAMVLPYDKERDMNPQDETFFSKPFWDFEGTPADRHPLLLHYHHMTLSRHQVCKQADTVLAYILLGDCGHESTVRNSFRYYESITTHDSSLSYAAFAILAAQLGDSEKAYEYFIETAALDLDDSHGNTKDGIHAANMGGTWLATVWGFGGFRPKGAEPSFNPVLPRKWKSLTYRIRYRGSVIEVVASQGSTRLTLTSGPPLDVFIYGDQYTLESELVVDNDKS